MRTSILSWKFPAISGVLPVTYTGITADINLNPKLGPHINNFGILYTLKIQSLPAAQ
jgi:hypothetical protein